MRSREFLSETTLSSASASSWPQYLQGLLDTATISIGDRGQAAQGLVIDQASKTKISALLTQLKNGADPRVLASTIKNTLLTFEKDSAGQTPLSQRIGAVFKSPELKSSQVNVRAAGLVGEALLGAAMYAKLTARGGDFVNAIDVNDLWEVINKIQPVGPQTVAVDSNDVNNMISDHIKLIIALPDDVQQLLTDPQQRGSFNEIAQSWVNYVNDDLSQRYADALYRNNRPDNVVVELAGKAGGKIDVKINVLDPQGQATKKREQVMLSVKLSNSLIGQKGRGKNVDEVYSNLVDLFAPFEVSFAGLSQDIKDTALRSGVQNQFVDAMDMAYKHAAEQIARAAGSTAKDVKLAQQIAEFIDQHATGGDDTIQVIEKTPGSDYRLLSYRQLARVFRQHDIDIAVDYGFSRSARYPGKNFPKIKIYDKNTPGPNGELVEIRFRLRGDYANHIIQPGNLLKELAAYRRFR